MTPDERIEQFWKAVDAAEEKYGVMLGYVEDEDGEPAPAALALEEVLDKHEVN
jgi:hypothetical protein